MSRKPWYLARRIRLAFVLTAAVLTLTISGLATRAVWSTVQDEIDALAKEELEETQAHCASAHDAIAGFDHVVRLLMSHHPSNPMAWRVWDPRTGERRGDYGAVEVLASASLPADLSPSPVALPGSRRWISDTLSPDLAVGILVDGSHQSRRLQRFVIAASVFVVVSTVLALLAGGVLGRWVARLLEHVAQSARAEGSTGASGDPVDAPQEIRAVVDALHDTLRRIRTEAENARLVTAGLAHELRSPLQNLIGETQVTLLRQREPDEYRRVLESHLEELTQLGRVVDNLVTLCAAGELRRRHGSELFDVGEEAQLRLGREFQLAHRREVRLVIETAGSLGYEGDRESLLLALRNVVTNAIEWSPRNGTVEVRFRGDGPRLEITVDDAGPGVPPAERARIFEPFHRGPAARGRRTGFGLGLALTRSAVEAHGGTIAVGDSPLGGARFRIRLQRAPEELREPEAPSLATPTDGDPTTASEPESQLSALERSA